MKKNMGNIDKIIRVLVALIITILFYTNIVSGTFSFILLLLASVFVLTSVISFCPLYTLVGVNTCSKK